MADFGAQGNTFILQNSESYIVFKEREDAVKYRAENRSFRYKRVKESLYHHPSYYKTPFTFGKLFIKGTDYD